MAKAISLFWPALETVAGQSAVLAEWGWLLKDELRWAVSRGLLVSSGELAGA